MLPGAGDRGLSEVVGFILIFGMLVTAFTVYQGIVVPDQNRQVEFEHNQQVHGDFQDLRNAIVSTAATGSGQAVSITLGATYPQRTIAQNLGVSGGTVQTTERDQVRIENARAINEETAHYFDGTPRTYETRSIRYSPVYSFYSNAPDTFYENSLVYNRFDEANLTLTDQTLVEGNQITLIMVNGSLSEAQQGTASISTEALSVSTNRVAVENTPGDRVNLTLPTRLSAETWEEILADEMDGGGFVEGVYDVPGEAAVIVSMEGGEPYELRMAKIGVGEDTVSETPHYLTSTSGTTSSLLSGSTEELVVEVRDRYHNPVSGVTVNVSSVTDGTVSPSDSVPTNSNGVASFHYTAPDSAGTEEVTFNISESPEIYENVTHTIQVDSSGGDGGSGDGDGGNTEEVNPADSAEGTVILEDVNWPGGNGPVEMVFDNTNSDDRTFERARISFFYPTGSGNNEISFGRLEGNPVDDLGIGDDFESIESDVVIPGSGSEHVEIDFRRSESQDGQAQDSFFVFSVKYEEESQVSTYFVSVPNN